MTYKFKRTPAIRYMENTGYKHIGQGRRLCNDCENPGELFERQKGAKQNGPKLYLYCPICETASMHPELPPPNPAPLSGLSAAGGADLKRGEMV